MSILILYGSETGTAQDIAESLRREAQMRHLAARVFELDEYDIGVSKNTKNIGNNRFSLSENEKSLTLFPGASSRLVDFSQLAKRDAA